MRIDLQPAFILHRRPYRNSSLLLEAYTEEQGRISLVARGANRPKGRWRGILQPFTPLLLSWLESSELGTLSIAEERSPAYFIKPKRVLCGLYLNELLLRLTARHDPSPEVFAAYEQALQGLTQTHNEELVLRRFEKTLLDELGYGLQLNVDSYSGEPIQAERLYYYHTQQGPQAADDPSVAGTVRNTLRGTIRGRTLLALEADRLHELSEPSELRQLKVLMRAEIGAHLDKPLRSRIMMAKLYQQNLRKPASAGA